MRLDDERQSNNIEDRRGGGSFGVGGGSIGIGGVVLALVVSYFTGVNPLTLLGLMSDQTPVSQQVQSQSPPTNDEMSIFVSKVLADTEDTWRDIFKQAGKQYRDPKLVLFTGATPTGCGTGRDVMGPFYCPADEKIYIDLAFYKDLKQRFQAPGEFAQAYVIAHEVGHHVQHLLGIATKVREAQERSRSKAQVNALSVKLELQADCFAGVWGYRADKMKHILEAGEAEQALIAASAIGDDRLQKQSQGYAAPDTFTHGTSEQRVHWFKKGMETGDIKACNTFQM
jgi:predicted metalloprotease